MTSAAVSVGAVEEVDEGLQRHIAALGLGGIASYKLWCRRHGLDMGLEKSVEERRAEIEIYEQAQPRRDPQTAKGHEPRIAALLGRIFAGDMADEKLPDMPHRVRAVWQGLEGDEVKAAYAGLVLHAEKYADLLRPMPIVSKYGHTLQNTTIAALGQLARHHGDWLRPLADWRPAHYRPDRQFGELVRHLLARYEVPSAMNAAFFQGDTPEARQQQGWFKHIGLGQNLRTAGVPMRVTKRMAHIFVQGGYWSRTVPEALRACQVLAMGGHRHLAFAVAVSPLGKGFRDEEFWETVVYFFVNNHPMLNRTYVEPIVDYILHQKYLPQRVRQPDGRVVEMPPQQPHFSMKGRSADKLLTQVDQWHAQLSADDELPLKRWPASGLKPFQLDEVDADSGQDGRWSFHELLTSAQLAVEGRVMHHCIASYADRCVEGGMSVWSLRLRLAEDPEGQQRHILTIAIDPKKRLVTQARGKYNLQPFDKKGASKQRRTGRPYLHHLRESARVLRLWMDREGLARGG